VDRGHRAGPTAALHGGRHLAGRRRLIRRLLTWALALPVVGAAVLALEAALARRGPSLPDQPRFDLDGRVGGDGPALGITWLGDSTASGVGATSPAASLPHQVAAALGRPVELTVLAVSGATVADVAEQQVGDVPKDADLVVIDVGCNDVTHLTKVGDFRRQYEAVLDRLPDGVPTVVLGVPDLGAPIRLAQPLRLLAGERAGTLDREVTDLAQRRGLRYVDIAGRTGPAFRREPGRYFSADLHHPSDEGYELWADAVVPAVRHALGE
jgi:lysophospholipase L1-like esterase